MLLAAAHILNNNKKMKKTLLAIILLVCVRYSYAQQTTFQMTYNIEQVSTKSGEGEFLDTTAIPEPLKFVSNIRLQKHGSFSTTVDLKKTTLYDFETEMIYDYRFDTLYNLVPLYSVIDYRVAEFQNRVFLAGLLQTGGAENVMGNEASLESIFGIEEEESSIKKQIKEKKEANTRVYIFDSKEFVKVTYSKMELPDEYAEAFLKFLIYETEIHPSIKEKIIKVGLVPSDIRYHYADIGTQTTVTYHLKAAKEMVTGEDDISKKIAYRPTADGDREMLALIDSMILYTTVHPVQPVDSTTYFKRSAELKKEGQYLSSLLRLLEYLLVSGNQPTNQIREIATFQQSDSLLATFLYCLNAPRAKEDALEKVLVLDNLVGLNLKYGYVMTIFAANYIEPINEQEAIHYFYKALSNNPQITGAWLDLGNIYTRRYRYNEAWKCYGIMLNLNAMHPMAVEIKEKKRWLKEHYPQYFK